MRQSALLLIVLGASATVGGSLFAAPTQSSASTVRTEQETQQPGAAGPKMSVELANESVRVFRIRLAPHERTGMHEVTPRVVVWLTNAHLRDSLATGAVQIEEHKAGEVSWVPLQRHSGLNTSSATVEFIAIEPIRHR